MQNSLSQLIDKEDWDALARMLISMRIDLGKKDRKLLRLSKEMQIIKHVLYEQLLTFNGSQTIDLSFFVGTLKTVLRIEKELEEKGIANNEFLIFMKLLLEKFKKQKISVKKPLEMQTEFGKLKGVVEDADL